MATTQHPSNDPAPVPSRKTVFLLLRTLADTTLRLFVPTIGGLLIGLWADSQATPRPLGALAGVTLGAITAGVLIFLQIKTINNETHDK
ncbi:MAG TPA: hypothetical protein VFZ48_00210 [Candidatus Saccharimonadales bacterium]